MEKQRQLFGALRFQPLTEEVAKFPTLVSSSCVRQIAARGIDYSPEGPPVAGAVACARRRLGDPHPVVGYLGTGWPIRFTSQAGLGALRSAGLGRQRGGMRPARMERISGDSDCMYR